VGAPRRVDEQGKNDRAFHARGATVDAMRRCTATVGQLQKACEGVRGAEAGAAFVLALLNGSLCFASFFAMPYLLGLGHAVEMLCPGAPPGAVKTD